MNLTVRDQVPDLFEQDSLNILPSQSNTVKMITKSIALIGSLILLSSTSLIECSDIGKEIDSTLCDYQHILELKESSQTTGEEFNKHFAKCIPIYGKWTAEAVEHMNLEQKQIVSDFHEDLEELTDFEDKLLFIMKKQYGKKRCLELVCDKQKFYQQLFLPILDQLCSGFEGTLNEVSRIYDILTGASTNDDSVTERLTKMRMFQKNSEGITFTWVTYARTCHILKDHRKYLSEEVRGLLLKSRGRSFLANRIMMLNPNRRCKDDDGKELQD